MARTPSTKIQYGLTKAEELERFFAAADRMDERARKDRSYALRLLREIGYFKMYPERDTGEDLANPPVSDEEFWRKEKAKAKPRRPSAKTKRAKAK
jgi:hypothetical protein